MTSITGIATSFIDFTRASNATVTDSDGKVKWAPHNLLTNSESFDAAAWAKTSGIVTITANQTVAPNGSTTADIFNEGTGAGYRLAEQAVSTIASVTYTVGFYAKYVSCQWVSLSLYSNSSATSYGAATFDLLNGVVGTSAAAGTGYAIVGSPVMEPIGAGWYRCSVTVTNGSSLPANYLAIAASNAGTIGSYGLNSYTGTSRTFSLWGAHLYRSDLAMQPNTSAYPMYNPTTPKNILGYTEDWTNDAWWLKTNIAAFGSGSAANSIPAPNGLQTADLLSATSTDSGVSQVFTSVANRTYTLSVYAKAGTITSFDMGGTNQGVANYWARFDLTAVTATNMSGGTTPAIVAVGNGWYRCSLQKTVTAGNSNDIVSIFMGNRAATVSGNSIYLWGAQLSDSASLDSYVPVYGAAVTSAAYYGPRRDFDPVTLACKGLLVEEQRTNRLLNSATLSTQNVTVTAAAHTLTFYGTGTITLSGTSTAGPLVGTGVNNRVSLTFTPSAGTLTLTVTGSVTQAQIELGSFATSYIPTGAATATRNADVASVSTQAFPYSATEGALIVSATTISTVATSGRYAGLNNGADRLVDLYAASSQYANYKTSDAQQTNFGTWQQSSKIGVVYKVDDYAFVANGTTVVTDTSTSGLTAANQLNLGNYNSSSQLNGHIRQITYLPRRISNADLTARTA